MLASHADLPIVVSPENAERFEKEHGRNLIEELDINEYGLSRIACMCPQCPFFKKPLGRITERDGKRCICPELQEHISGCLMQQGLHKTVHQNKGEKEVDVLAKFLEQCVLYRMGEPSVSHTLRHIRDIKIPVQWADFTKHFV